MSKTVNIFLYSYKNKKLLDNVIDIYDKSSKNNNIKIFVYDQNNLNRSKNFNKLKYVNYTHINWDSTIQFANYRDSVINKNFEYYLEIGDNVVLSNNWDKVLIEYLQNKKNIILSGIGNVKIFCKNNKLQKTFSINNNFNLTNFVDLNFIFIKKENVNILKNSKLRFYNQDLLFSLLYLNNFINIYSVPSYLYINNKQSFLENIYTPYSLYENYNLAIEYIKNNNCDFFMKYHNFDLNEIIEINENIINPKYHYQDYLMDNNQTRFITNTKNIFTKTFFNNNVV